MGTGSLFDLADSESAVLRARLGGLARERIYIGCSSWKYQGWLDQIYTRSNYLSRGRFSKKAFEAECLREYAGIFPTVCGDFAFYQFPSEAFWQRLFSQTPAGFQFAFKVPEQITSRTYPSFLDFHLLQEAFLRPLEPYKEKVGPLIFEFTAFARGVFSDVREFLELLDPFLGSLPRHFRYGVEIRNEEFLERPYFECLGNHGVAHVFNAWSRMPELKEQLAIREAVTADFLICRALLRRGRLYEQAVKTFSPYTRIQDPNPEARAGLRELIERARESRSSAYIYVNNRLEGNAPATILAVTTDGS